MDLKKHVRWITISGKNVRIALTRETTEKKPTEEIALDKTKWRVPTIEELISLIDYSEHSPALPKGHLFEVNDDKSFFWSSTIADSNRSSAWHVDFGYGGVYYCNKNNGLYVRCVRSGCLGYWDNLDTMTKEEIALDTRKRFVDNGDGTVLDQKTGLTWQKTSDKKMTWLEAMKYCKDLELGDIAV